MVQAFMYKRIECKKNKSLVWCIDLLVFQTVHEIIERLKDINFVFTFVFDLCMVACRLIDRILYYCAYQSNSSSIVR